MEQQHDKSSSKKLFIILGIAIAALLIGSVGLIVSLRKPELPKTDTSATPMSGNSGDIDKLPDGAKGPVNSTEINGSDGDSGVVKSPEKP
ncbi:MAG TPA: hypothetical protein VFH06_04165 [Candidatus Saccharimonadales bacterium]|nr:hypothetical protein [Candidatus Saccharimonadales bacterium]